MVLYTVATASKIDTMSCMLATKLLLIYRFIRRFELIASLLAYGLVDFGTSRYGTAHDALVGECPRLYEHYTKRNVFGEIYLRMSTRHPHRSKAIWFGYNGYRIFSKKCVY